MKNDSSDAIYGEVLPMMAGEAPVPARPAQAEAEAAMRTLLAWLGDDPRRAGLAGTPNRVATAFPDLLNGYRTDPVALLKRSIMPNDGGGQLIVLRAIRVVSFCERHFLPIVGQAHVGYVPRHSAVGIGAIAAVVDAATRRLQIQEQITDDITRPIWDTLEPEGLAVVVEAEHLCMTARGSRKRAPASSRVVSSVVLPPTRRAARPSSAWSPGRARRPWVWAAEPAGRPTRHRVARRNGVVPSRYTRPGTAAPRDASVT